MIAPVTLTNKTASYFTSKNEFFQEEQRIAIQDQQARTKPWASPENREKEHTLL